MRQRLNRFILLVLLCVAAAGGVYAQEENSVRISAIDSSDFPIIRINLITADAQSAPLTDFSALSLRENGIPVGDLELSHVPVGVNAIFVIDANATFDQIDPGSDLTRQEKVKQSIIRYTTQFMGDDDRVAIVVPDEIEGDGRFLVEHAVTRDAVASNIASYNPELMDQTPLNDMMLLALAHAADGVNEGRFQAILLFTDGSQMQRQLDFPTLVAQAQRIDLPIFTAILGERVDPVELESAALLFEPTRASYAHMPEAIGTDPIYQTWRSQGMQTQISFRSLQTSSGRYPITVNLGSARALSEYTLSLAPPAVTISAGNHLIRRQGDSHDTPVTLLEPMHVPLQVSVQWPDNSPRDLATVNLFVDSQPQLMPSVPVPDAEGNMVLDWNISGLDAAEYTLVVRLVDELGLSAVSEPASITIVVDRPLPPTPTAAPTVAAAPPVQTGDQQALAVPKGLLVPLLAVAGTAALALLMVRRHRRGAEQKRLDVPVLKPAQPVDTPPGQVEAVPHIAFLEMLEAGPGHVARIRIEGDSVTVGRDHTIAQIVFAEESVARLHARIKKRDGRYWLYDEGSASGTFHNYQRLGLTPQPLEDQDTIHFGHVGLRFHLQQVVAQPPSGHEEIHGDGATVAEEELNDY